MPLLMMGKRENRKREGEREKVKKIGMIVLGKNLLAFRTSHIFRAFILLRIMSFS